MVLAADYPFLDVLWTMIIFFAWICWIWMMIAILTDVFRRRDISGWAKAGWCVFLIVMPFLGALVYLIAQHDSMTERSARQAQAHKQAFDTYDKSVAADGGPDAEIEKAQGLLDSGAISKTECDA